MRLTFKFNVFLIASFFFANDGMCVTYPKYHTGVFNVDIFTVDLHAGSPAVSSRQYWDEATSGRDGS